MVRKSALIRGFRTEKSFPGSPTKELLHNRTKPTPLTTERAVTLRRPGPAIAASHQPAWIQLLGFRRYRHSYPICRNWLGAGIPQRGDFDGLGRTPERVHADVVAAPEAIHSSAVRT